MRNVWQGGLIAAAVVLGSLAATALAKEKGKSDPGKSDLGEKPAIQGESWLGSTGAQDPTMGERRTDKQLNAIETAKEGRSGTIPDASKGETGLKGEPLSGRSDGEKKD
ncbi:MAG TPA: hypothetical protein VD995_32100 [Azospirillum sp.]|nr:hypothetical protein [Azospirillum sp.]